METIDINTKLVNGCMRGDRSSQHQLYKQYSRGMYSVCLRMMGDGMLAEDMLQEAFVDVFKNIHTFKGDSTPGAWIKRIVVNKCLSQLRKKKIHLADIDDVKYIPEEVVEEQDHSYEVARIKQAINLLPHGYRVIFSLYAMEGYDHEEISQVMGVSVSTSKSQYHRAKKKIKELLQLNHI